MQTDLGASELHNFPRFVCLFFLFSFPPFRDVRMYAFLSFSASSSIILLAAIDRTIWQEIFQIEFSLA